MKEGTVATFGRGSEFLEGGYDIGISRGSMGAIILVGTAREINVVVGRTHRRT